MKWRADILLENISTYRNGDSECESFEKLKEEIFNFMSTIDLNTSNNVVVEYSLAVDKAINAIDEANNTEDKVCGDNRERRKKLVEDLSQHYEFLSTINTCQKQLNSALTKAKQYANTQKAKPNLLLPEVSSTHGGTRNANDALGDSFTDSRKRRKRD